jgi:hypothetical protein
LSATPKANGTGLPATEQRGSSGVATSSNRAGSWSAADADNRTVASRDAETKEPLYDSSVKVDGNNMDPEIAAEIQYWLGAIGELWDRYHVAARHPIETGTLAAADEALPHARFVSIQAAQALVSALDHLSAWGFLVDARRIPIQAHMTLMRGALEGSVRCRWLVDPTIDSTIRVARGYAAKRDDHLQRRRFEESSERIDDEDDRPNRKEMTGMSADERLEELEGWRSEAAIPVVRFDGATALMKAYGLERWFRLASAAAHGKEWVLAAAQLVASPEAIGRAGVSHGIVSADDEVVLGLTLVSIQATVAAVDDFERYASGPATSP